MCGIVAIISNKINVKKISNDILIALEHRGTDSRNIYLNDNKTVALGHNRLSINDLTDKGNQPFILKDKISVTNGEIWNYKKLKETLNYNFKSNSDSEIIIPMYIENRLKELDGMFSFIILDKDKLIISRDWVGKLPLFYADDSKGIYIASEIKAIKQVTNTTDIKFIPKNCLMTIDINTKIIDIETNYYGWIESTTKLKSDSHIEVAKQTYNLLDKAIKKRLMSDVPIATLNSGGIDSSVITYIASKYVKKLKCYTVKFDENSEDLKYARILAKHLNIDLIEVEVPKDDIIIKQRFMEVVKCIEYPSNIQVQCGIMLSYVADKIAKDGFKVVLSGEGADEQFGSYSRLRMFSNKPDWCEIRKELFKKQYYGNLIRGNNIFMKFATVELRTPFFDRDLINYTTNLSNSFTSLKQQYKLPLANAFKDKLPDEIINRPKTTFQRGTNFKDWFEDIILSDKKINFNNRKKMYHIILDNTKKILNYDVKNVRKDIKIKANIIDLFE